MTDLQKLKELLEVLEGRIEEFEHQKRQVENRICWLKYPETKPKSDEGTPTIETMLKNYGQ